MLDEREWEILEPHLSRSLDEIKQYRQQADATLPEATALFRGKGALAIYAQLSGFEETNFNALYHHRRSLYGPDCAACGKPLRTTRARFCAACGAVPVAGVEPGV